MRGPNSFYSSHAHNIENGKNGPGFVASTMSDLASQPKEGLTSHQPSTTVEEKQNHMLTKSEYMDPESNEEAGEQEQRRLHVEISAVENGYARKVYCLNKIIDEHIGMTRWQWGLLFVAGMGWFLDNAWLPLIAVILPQIQVEFFTDGYQEAHIFTSNPAWVTFSLFVGMLVGASFWGYAADIVGRRLSFNITLFICGVFAIASGGAKTFAALAALVGVSCFGIGGSLPVDGMLFLEFLPGSHQYLLTLLSVFWSLGQLVTSLIGWGFISRWNCESHDACAINRTSQGWLAGNVGWRYLIFTTGAYTLFVFFIRFVIFRIPESPKFYLSKGRDAEAVQAMHEFARKCGKPLPEGMLTVGKLRSIAGEEEFMDAVEGPVETHKSMTAYFTYWWNDIKYNFQHSKRVSPFAQIAPLFSTISLGYTTVVTWLLWLLIGLAYPLFNSFIILYLGSKGDTSLSRNYRNYVIISVCGVPGSVIGAWMVTWPLAGRRGAMAIGTILSGIFLFIFIADGHTAERQLAYFAVTNFFENIMYGVLYCYTPEMFPAPLRGTADGIAAMMNRIMGVVATLIKIYTTTRDQSTGSSSQAAPLYTSAALFVASGLLMLTLRVETASRTAL